MKQELAAVEKQKKQIQKLSPPVLKDQFNKALNNKQKAKLAAETVFINANSKQNEAIKAVNKNWSLADENISTKLSVIVNGESKTQAILAEK